jgi:outer membrane protein
MAQPVAGNKFIGGGLSFTTNGFEQGTGNPDRKISEFTVAPSGGYFLSDKVALGLNLSFMNGKDDDGTTVDKYSELAIGPFAQYYMPIKESPFSFLAEAGFLYGATKDNPAGPGEVSGNSLTVYVSPGFTYFFAKSWALDFKLRGIAFNSSDPNTDGASEGDKDSYFTFGVNSFNPSLGFRFIF